MFFGFDLKGDFDFSGRRIALVGGGGFIGHNLALQLKILGADVHIIDGLTVNNLAYFAPREEVVPNRRLYMNLIQERLDLLEDAGVPVHVEDARDYHALSRVLTQVEPDSIVHLAAIAHANRANKDPFSTFDHSLRTLENSLDFARSRNVHFVYFSSSMVYGDFENGIVDEKSPCNPIGIYAALKFSAEKILAGYNQVFGLPYTIIRPSALYGERCVSRRIGQAFIENALKGIDLTVNGDGSDKLDFTYIGDLIQGIVRCLYFPEAHNQVFNLTFGNGRTINELANIVREHFPKIKVSHQQRDSLMPERGTLSNQKARDLLKFQPSYPLEIGFVEYIEWYKRRANELPLLFPRKF
jgi:nucleoside-diphosphate-sugar epimerase